MHAQLEKYMRSDYSGIQTLGCPSATIFDRAYGSRALISNRIYPCGWTPQECAAQAGPRTSRTFLLKFPNRVCRIPKRLFDEIADGKKRAGSTDCAWLVYKRLATLCTCSISRRQALITLFRPPADYLHVSCQVIFYERAEEVAIFY